MRQYTFTGPKGEYTTVIAVTEQSARDLAMYSRWGEPDGIILRQRPYVGWGLYLISTEEVKE